jgi:hypothetical protein
MATTVCAYCNSTSHMTIRWGEIYQGGNEVRLAATCDNCRNVSLANGKINYSQKASHSVDVGHVSAAISGFEEQLEWWPRVGVSPTISDVPDDIAKAAREAYSSASINNHMAAILMARTVVEATAKNKNITSGTLASKINAMKDAQLIRPSIAEQAHEIRFMGNDMAHGDIADQPDYIDSEEILALMAEVLSEVFQGPARLERIRNKRAKPSA